MSRINTNVPALLAARNLATNQASMNSALQRLSTGLRINTGKDDPAGLIASNNLKSEATAINAALDNANRANNMVAVSEGALGEVNNLLVQLEDLTDRSASQAGLSSDEVKANQLQIDSILDSVNRIANTTSFQGKKLLNGSFDYTKTGVAQSALATVNVNSAKLPEGGTRTVVVQLTASAQYGKIKFATSQVGVSATTIKVAGNFGSEMFSFAGSTKVSGMVYAINQVKELTGVSATQSGVGAGKALYFNSIDYGSQAYVSVSKISGGAFTTDKSSSYGTDASVTINGTAAITDGLNASVRTSSLSVDVTLSSAFGGGTGGKVSKSFSITGGGATFSLAPEISLAGQESLGIASVTTADLGDGANKLSSLGSGQANELSSKNFATAQRIIRSAVSQVSNMRGRLGSFQKETLQSTMNSLKVAYENTQAAQSAISDADFATETSNMTRAQILIQSSTSVLKMSNQAPQNVLSLLQ
jgi:flagellin